MNIYQHLLILVPSFIIAYWGFYTKETTGAILAAFTGLAVILSYLIYFVIFSLLGTFEFLSNFKFIT